MQLIYVEIVSMFWILPIMLYVSYVPSSVKLTPPSPVMCVRRTGSTTDNGIVVPPLMTCSCHSIACIYLCTYVRSSYDQRVSHITGDGLCVMLAAALLHLSTYECVASPRRCITHRCSPLLADRIERLAELPLHGSLCIHVIMLGCGTLARQLSGTPLRIHDHMYVVLWMCRNVVV